MQVIDKQAQIRVPLSVLPLIEREYLKDETALLPKGCKRAIRGTSYLKSQLVLNSPLAPAGRGWRYQLILYKSKKNIYHNHSPVEMELGT
jgi:hypothetical protein